MRLHEVCVFVFPIVHSAIIYDARCICIRRSVVCWDI